MTRLPGAPEPMHEWPGGDGLTIRGDSWGEPSGRPVILMHGGGQTRHAWRGAGETLGNAGYYEYFDPMTGDGCGGKDFTWTAAIELILQNKHYAPTG